MSEFHDLAEALLNEENKLWGNLGYWQGAKNYSRACELLAHKLAEFAGLDSESCVFDAGFGCGDQLLLWLNDYRIQQLAGINYSNSQTEMAQQRLIHAGFIDQAAAIKFGSVADLSKLKLSKSNISKSKLSLPAINRVLALDCIYHFPDKAQFLRDSAQLLQPHGVLAYSDFQLAGSLQGWRGQVVKTMFRLSRIAVNNVQLPEADERLLHSHGFSDVERIDISEWVMPGFRHWLSRYKQQKKAALWSWLKYDVTAAFLNWAYQHKLLSYVLVRAVKR